MQWLLAKTRGIFIEISNDESVAGPSEVLYALDVAEHRQDTYVS
jgi:hypothetical protein